MSTEHSIHSTRGTALMLVLIVGAALSIAVVSTLQMMFAEFRTVHKQSRQIIAYHLAEGGIELALADLMRTHTQAGLEARGWTRNEDSGLYQKVMSPEEMGWSEAETTIGSVKLLFEDPESGEPIRVWANSTVEGGSRLGRAGEQFLQVRVRLNNGTASYPYVGVTAFDEIRGARRSDPVFDSYDSSVFPYTYAVGINNGSNILIAATATDSSMVDLAKAQIFGDVAIGTESDTPTVDGSPTISGSLTGYFQTDNYSIIPPSNTNAETTLYAP